MVAWPTGVVAWQADSAQQGITHQGRRNVNRIEERDEPARLICAPRAFDERRQHARSARRPAHHLHPHYHPGGSAGVIDLPHRPAYRLEVQWAFASDRRADLAHELARVPRHQRFDKA